MGANSKIEWCDATFNPWRGCTKVSAGCANCYAETMSHRNPAVLGTWGPKGKRVVASEAMWRQPRRWNAEAELARTFWQLYQERFITDSILVRYSGPYQRPRVFCASLADVFEDWDGTEADGVTPQAMCDAHGNKLATRTGRETVVQWPHESGWRPLSMIDVRERLWNLIEGTPALDWLLLTKRPENLRYMVPWMNRTPHEPWPNVWLGTSVENQTVADKRIPELLKIPAKVRFLSCEPLLGPINLKLAPNALIEFDWVICGGESGPKARPMHPQWVRSLRDQCDEAGTPFFFKQWGEWAPNWESATWGDGRNAITLSIDGKPRVVGPSTESDALMHKIGRKAAGRELDGREWSEFPQPHPGDEL